MSTNWLIVNPKPVKEAAVIPTRAQSVNPNLNFEFLELLGLFVFCGEFVEVLFVWEVLPILECTLPKLELEPTLLKLAEPTLLESESYQGLNCVVSGFIGVGLWSLP